MTGPRLVLTIVLTIGLLATPLAAAAQPTRTPRIGWLSNGSPAPVSPNLEAFRRVFVVNLKTAKALGLTIPPSVLSRVDLAIE